VLGAAPPGLFVRLGFGLYSGMRLRRSLYCLAVVGACLQPSHYPIEEDDPPTPAAFVISAPTVSTSTARAVLGGRTFWLSTG